LATLWQWHASEESEHRCTAFDVYCALGGNHRWRVRWMRIVATFFVTDVLRQTVDNLRRSGDLWRWSTWRSAAAFLFGRTGLVRCTYRAWRDYFRPDFHPSQHDGMLGQRWLAEHAEAFTAVGAR
jgi:predicted metal-dependent hydrolase